MKSRCITAAGLLHFKFILCHANELCFYLYYLSIFNYTILQGIHLYNSMFHPKYLHSHDYD